MNISSTLNQLHYQARKNRWLGYFATFNRVALAAGFIPSGLQKVMGIRFTVLSELHPMGAYLEAIYHTGFYYPFVGVMQVIAALLLLIPRTALLGAVIYFPIILNICILSLSVRFDGSLLSSPLMVLANLYLLCWDYHRLKAILPFKSLTAQQSLPPKEEQTSKFPWKFFAGVAMTCSLVILHSQISYNIMPRNTHNACLVQCQEKENPQLCQEFCHCVHKTATEWDNCLDAFNKGSYGPTKNP